MENYFPAEWQPQSGVMLTWPHKQTDFASELSQVEIIFCTLAAVISRYERVIICSSDAAHSLHIQHLLSQIACDLQNIRFFEVESNDCWARDHGPLTVIRNNQPLLLDFKFNGWGNKYPHHLDDAINAKLAASGAFRAPVKSLSLVLEGGSIETDGQGTLLTTSQCLLATSRNPSLSKPALERKLIDILGVNRVLWLDEGKLLGDDTDGHIDMLARFINPETICHMICNDEQDPHRQWMHQLKQNLQRFRKADGKPYTLVELPFPSAQYSDTNERLPASYCNFLILNTIVLMPVYDCPQDALALETLSNHFPDRTVIPVDCRALIAQHGSLHCVTMQFPAGVLAE